MKILITSPLFPPDIASPAPYTKELSARLAEQNEVTVVAFTYLPEHVPNVKVIAVNKRLPLFQRLFSYMKATSKEIKNTDFVIIENGISTEWVTPLLCKLFKTPYLYDYSDLKNDGQNNESVVKSFLHSYAKNNAVNVIHHNAYTLGQDSKLSKPEIFSFKDTDDVALQTYNEAWESHLEKIYSTSKTWA